MFRLLFVIVVALAIVVLIWHYSYTEVLDYAPADAEYVEPTIHENFITEEESNYVMDLCRGKFKESLLVSGTNKEIRDSKTVWLYKTDAKIKEIMQRVCNVTSTRLEQVEPMQVVKYDPGGYYNNHHDSCCDKTLQCKEFIKKGGQRIYTMLIYLSDDFTGGKTVFPNLKKEYQPKKLSGLLFCPLEKNGCRCHPLALHKGAPVLEGVKYICNVWVREKDIPS